MWWEVGVKYAVVQVGGRAKNKERLMNEWMDPSIHPFIHSSLPPSIAYHARVDHRLASLGFFSLSPLSFPFPSLLLLLTPQLPLVGLGDFISIPLFPPILFLSLPSTLPPTLPPHSSLDPSLPPSFPPSLSPYIHCSIPPITPILI